MRAKGLRAGRHERTVQFKMSITSGNRTQKRNQTVRLRDGRQLGFAEYGVSDGRPVFYFHGWPSSRLEAEAMEEVPARLGVRLIAPDRPGYGLSDFKPGRTLGDWAADVSELAERLELTRFGVLGISGGGPYALACAARIPENLSAVLLVVSVAPVESPEVMRGMVPLNRFLLGFARHAPWLALNVGTFFLRFFWGQGEQPTPPQIESRLPATDRNALTDPSLRQALITSSREALRGGVWGAAWDGFLYARPWDFRLQEIRSPVHVWHGEKDIVVPVAMGRYLARMLPDCRATFYPDEGHFSLPFGRMEEILREALK